MAATLFYAEDIPAIGFSATVEGDEGFHAATVRRIRPAGDWRALASHVRRGRKRARP